MTISEHTTGAWLLHHDQKLSHAKTTEFENIATAGRSARILSAISRESEWDVSMDRVQELARANGIRRHEVKGLLETLSGQGLIDLGTSGVAVLGVSQALLLEHAANIFDSLGPESEEKATIELAELASQLPVSKLECMSDMADKFKISSANITQLFDVSERIGFVDYEKDGDDRIYFNGTLFRRGSADKARNILDGMTAEERGRLQTVQGLFASSGCLQLETVRQELGPQLWSKLHQIGFFDVSSLTNERGETIFVMLPSALSKYIPGGLADMLDDAKALASSLTYGIIKSEYARGQIRDPAALLNALISRGYVEGPVAAIHQDYQVLERRGVVRVTPTSKGHRLTLHKTEIGEMARDLILKGDASAVAAQVVIGSLASQFYGPETKRIAERLNPIPETRASVSRTLDILRKSAR